MKPEGFKIISGGQTGADRAALDFAMKNGIEHGGWCPKGRRSEDGTILGQYQLQETPSADYLQRTEWNVRQADGTVIFSLAESLSGGSLETLNFAQEHEKPWIYLSATRNEDTSKRLWQFIEDNHIRVLNVAGPRACEEPEVERFVTATLHRLVKLIENSPIRLDAFVSAGTDLDPFWTAIQELLRFKWPND